MVWKGRLQPVSFKRSAVVVVTMQVVSDLQQRTKKGRLKVEKRIVPFYDLCSLVQLTVFLIHTVTTMIGANRTFRHSIIISNDFELSPSIVYKTQSCSYTTVRSIYAFSDVNMTFNASSINDVFVDDAIQMRLAIFICAVTFFIGGVNRSFVEMNFFVWKKRNFCIWKDIVSAAELLMLGYVAEIAAASGPPSLLLRDYLRHCGIESNSYLPFISHINLWVFVGVGYFTYVVGIFIYLWNALPKYGVMSPEEIEEYKAWLRVQRAEREQSRKLIEEAKKAHARIQILNSTDYKKGAQGLLPPTAMMPSVPVMGPDGVLYPYPYAAFGPPGFLPGGSNSQIPPPQLFGANMPPMAMPGSYAAPLSMGAAAPLPQAQPSQPPINMPRRRTTSSAVRDTSGLYESGAYSASMQQR